MTTPLSRSEHDQVARAARTTDLLAQSQQKLAHSQRLNVIFIGVAVVLVLFLLYQQSGQGRQIVALSRDVRECTTPSERGDRHECYERAQADVSAARAANRKRQDDIKAVAEQARTAADQAKRGADAAAQAATFLANCFKPGGECTKASERNQEFIREQLMALARQVQSFEFHVTGTLSSGSTFEGTARAVEPSAEQACLPPVTVGEVGIGQGVVCRDP